LVSLWNMQMWNRLVPRDEKILYGLVLLLKWES
jgi:hypothetical protein